MPRPIKEDVVVGLHVICLQPLDTGASGPVEVGLQDRTGAVHAGQVRPDGSVLYAAVVTATRREDSMIRFRGPYVHGTATAPFLYLSVKRLEPTVGQAPWVRRLKIPLPILPWATVEAAPEMPVFTARVSGTQSGTVPLLDAGWIQTEDAAS